MVSRSPHAEAPSAFGLRRAAAGPARCPEPAGGPPLDGLEAVHHVVGAPAEVVVQRPVFLEQLLVGGHVFRDGGVDRAGFGAHGGGGFADVRVLPGSHSGVDGRAQRRALGRSRWWRAAGR